jgi:hypothetical protein
MRYGWLHPRCSVQPCEGPPGAAASKSGTKNGGGAHGSGRTARSGLLIITWLCGRTPAGCAPW